MARHVKHTKGRLLFTGSQGERRQPCKGGKSLKDPGQGGDASRCGTEDEWKLLLPALLATCSMKAARGWLGYVPPEIEAEATALISSLKTGQHLPGTSSVFVVKKGSPATQNQAKLL